MPPARCPRFSYAFLVPKAGGTVQHCEGFNPVLLLPMDGAEQKLKYWFSCVTKGVSAKSLELFVY